MKTIFISIILFLIYPVYARAEIERYICTEVKTDIVDDKVQYSIKKENHVEFTLKDCLPENLKVQVKSRNILYQQSRRIVEDGRIEKNDLFAIECNQPFPEDGNLADYKGINFRFYRAKISPLITPEYPLYPTLKQTAEKINLETPHRTFVIFGGLGGASHEFFCYVNEKPSEDRCKYSLDEVLAIHEKNENSVAIKDLAEKYFKRFDYEKAEKAYKKLIKFSKDEGAEGLISLYIATGQYEEAAKVVLALIKKSPYNALLYTSLAEIYLYEREYDKAESLIHKALKLRFERDEYKAYVILGEVYTGEGDHKNAGIYFEKASKLFEKECEDNRLFSGFFNKEGIPAIDCQLQALPYQLKIIYSLTELEDFNRAEKMAKELLVKAKNNPYLYGNLSYIYAGKGAFDKAIEMADKAISLFKRRGIGANIVKGEIYPVVLSVSRNTPAEKAGLQKGDKIINIGDKDLRLFREGKDIIQMLVEYIDKNETVRLTIHSDNSYELSDVELQPEEILKPDASQALAFKALILRIKGNFDEFRKQAFKAYEVNPENKLTQVTMALAIVDNKTEEALEMIDELDKKGNDSLVLLIRPIIYAKAGKIDKAKELYKEIPKELLKTKNALYKGILDEINKSLKGG